MPDSNPDVGDQVTRVADYDALRDVANQLAGLLVARQRGARTPGEAAAWRQEHRDLRTRLDEIRPGAPEVSAALQEWGTRLADLRQDAG